MKRRFRAMLVSACVLAELAGCAAAPVQRLAQHDVAALPKLETARSRADHEEIAAWYERKAGSADRQGAAHLRMRDAYAMADRGYDNAAVVAHCRNLILRYQQSAQDNLTLARLHRRVAEEVSE
jgi:hypothetical protein